MRRVFWIVAGVVVAVAVVACGARAALRRVPFAGLRAFEDRPIELRLEARTFRLDNGMLVVLAPDARTNLVEVLVRYGVGGVDDPAEHPGLAHFVEHLLFLGRTGPGAPTIADRLEDAALAYDATTEPSATTYQAIGFAGDVDELLAIEADRLAHGCGGLDDAVFRRERDVVLAEALERGASGSLVRAILELFDEDHPARWWLPRPPRLGGVDRDAACAFVARHYVPSNAVLVVTGQLDVAAVEAAIRTRFGALAARPAPPRAAWSPLGLAGQETEAYLDRDGALAVFLFRRPVEDDRAQPAHDHALELLGELVDDAGFEHDWYVAHDVTSIDLPGGGLSAFSIWIARDVYLDQAIGLVREAIAELPDAVDAASLDAARARTWLQRARWLDELQGRARWLAGRVAARGLDAIGELARVDPPTAADVQASIAGELAPDRARVLRLSRHVGNRRERDEVAIPGADHDVAVRAATADPGEARRPIPLAKGGAGPIERVTLGNGLVVVLAPDQTAGIVAARLVFPVGWTADPFDRRYLAEMAAELLDDPDDDALAPGDADRVRWGRRLGTALYARAGEVTTIFGAHGTAAYADWHLWRLYWRVEAGDYAGLGAYKRALRTTPAPEDGLGLLARQKMYGADHPYARAIASSDARLRLTARDLEAHRARRYDPSRATLIVAGAFDRAALLPQLEATFGALRAAPDAAPPARVAAIQPAIGPVWLAGQRRGAAQTRLSIAFVARPGGAKELATRRVLARILRERLRVVREGMGASYGVAVTFHELAAATVLAIGGEIDAARAGEVAALVLAEIERVRARPDEVAADFVRARRRELSIELARVSGVVPLADQLVHEAARGDATRGDALAAAIAAVTIDDLAALAATELGPGRMIASVRGDPTTIRAVLDAAGVERATATLVVD